MLYPQLVQVVRLALSHRIIQLVRQECFFQAVLLFRPSSTVQEVQV
jgi:hypothetical protein